MKIIKVFIFMLLFLIAGCENAPAEPAITPSPSVPEYASTTEGAEEDVSDFIIGVWQVQFAKDGVDGTEYPLQNLYGTGIQYGGTLTLHNNNTFTKLMGITDELSENDGTFSLEGNVITFTFKDGSMEDAVYLPSSHEIEYHTQDIFDVPVYEYFIKTDQVDQ